VVLMVVELVEIMCERRPLAYAAIEATKTSRRSFEMNSDGFVSGAPFAHRGPNIGAIVFPQSGQVRAGNLNGDVRDLWAIEKLFARSKLPRLFRRHAPRAQEHDQPEQPSGGSKERMAHQTHPVGHHNRSAPGWKCLLLH